jgi:hypothetical protein
MGHDHAHRADYGEHAHEHDRGARGFLRYLRLLPHMWRSDVNREVVRSVAPRSGECVVDLGAGMGAATVEAAMSGATVVAGLVSFPRTSVPPGTGVTSDERPPPLHLRIVWCKRSREVELAQRLLVAPRVVRRLRFRDEMPDRRLIELDR